MDFTKENGILIKVLRQSKGYSAIKLLEEFPDNDISQFPFFSLYYGCVCQLFNKREMMMMMMMTGHVQHWADFCGRLTLQGLQTGSPAAAENVLSAQETCKCLCKWRPL